MGKFSFQLNQSIMRYVAAALLAGLGGKSIDANNIKSILGSVGIEAESEKNRFGSQGTCWQGSRRTYCRRTNQISFNASRRRRWCCRSSCKGRKERRARRRER